MVLLHGLERGNFAQSWISSPMKSQRGRQYSFQKLTQFTMLNMVLDPLPSTINDCLTCATLLLPFNWTGWFCKSWWPSPIWKHWEVGRILLNG
jgi:hypothetical protein